MPSRSPLRTASRRRSRLARVALAALGCGLLATGVLAAERKPPQDERAPAKQESATPTTVKGAKGVTAARGADLAVRLEAPARSASKQTLGSLRATVRNAGKAPSGHYRLVLELRPEGSLGPGKALARQSGGSLAPGAMRTHTLIARRPAPGRYRLCARIETEGERPGANDESCNRLEITAPATAPPSRTGPTPRARAPSLVDEGRAPGRISAPTSAGALEITDLQVERFSIDEAAVAPGDTVHFDYKLKNTGNTEVGCDVQVFFSKELNDRSAAARVYEAAEPAHAIDPASHHEASFHVPRDVDQGRYFVTLVLDPEDAVEETNERNNQQFWPVDVTLAARPIEADRSARDLEFVHDVSVDQLQVTPAEIELEAPFTVSFRLHNGGETRAVVGYRVALGTARESPSTDLASDSVTLPAGGSETVSLTFSLPWDHPVVPAGIWVFAGVEGQHDANPADNHAGMPVTLRASSLPDLEVTRFEVEYKERTADDDVYTVTVGIRNSGTRAAPRSRYDIDLAAFYSDDHSVLGDQPYSLGTEHVNRYYWAPRLDVGHSVQRTHDVSVPANRTETRSGIFLAAGVSSLDAELTVDSPDQVPELSEHNNRSSVHVR